MSLFLVCKVINSDICFGVVNTVDSAPELRFSSDFVIHSCMFVIVIACFFARGGVFLSPTDNFHLVPFNAGTDLRLRDSGGQEGGKDKPDALLLTALPIQRVTCYQLSSCR